MDRIYLHNVSREIFKKACRHPAWRFLSDENIVNSTLMEVGNVFSSAFCDDAAEMLGMVLLPTPPSYGKDFTIAVTDAVVSQLAEKSDYCHI